MYPACLELLFELKLAARPERQPVLGAGLDHSGETQIVGAHGDIHRFQIRGGSHPSEVVRLGHLARVLVVGRKDVVCVTARARQIERPVDASDSEDRREGRPMTRILRGCRGGADLSGGVGR